MDERPVKAKNLQDGFTLIEILIAIFLLTVTLVGVATVMTTTMKGGDFSKTVTSATTLAKDKFEELKGAAYANLADGSDTKGIYSRTWTVTSATSPSDYKTLLVTVSWEWQGKSHQVELKTIRAKD